MCRHSLKPPYMVRRHNGLHKCLLTQTAIRLSAMQGLPVFYIFILLTPADAPRLPFSLPYRDDASTVILDDVYRLTFDALPHTPSTLRPARYARSWRDGWWRSGGEQIGDMGEQKPTSRFLSLPAAWKKPPVPKHTGAKETTRLSF